MAEEKNITVNFQRMLQEQWSNKLQAAKEAKTAFDKIGDQCNAFFARDSGFMWEAPFYDTYLEGVEKPYFRVTINKTAEFVDIYKPYLLWDCPNRYLNPYKPPDVPQEALMMLADPNDPMGQMMLRALVQDNEKRKLVTKLRVDLWTQYLNYTPREQRHKLEIESGFSLLDALIRGRGCLWAEAYNHPGSNRRLTGLFYGSVMDLLIDPDCSDPALKTATWIARRHVTTCWELERKIKVPDGTLREYATLETADSRISNRNNMQRQWRKEGKTHDLIVWYEIFSRAGIGTRQIGVHQMTTQHELYEDLVGDNAYLMVAPSVPWLLNAPPPLIFKEDEDEVAARFAWPCPLVPMDSRWPVALLDFKKQPNSAWPLPPLMPAMGELICLNILVSAALERAYESRKLVIGYLKSESKQVEEKLKKESKGTVFFEISDSLQKSVKDCIQYLEQPNMNRDIWDAIEYVSMLFDKRTGLMPFIYGDESGSKERSARAVSAKEEHVSIRPDQMARDVAAWQTEAAELERLVAAPEIMGADLLPLLGPIGVKLWDMLIAEADPEELAREMTATVEASDIRKPNKEREAANIREMMGWLLPVMEQVATLRGDEEGVRGLNAFIVSIGKAMDQDTSDWTLPPFAPQPDPQMLQVQQMLQQTEIDKGQAEADSKRADAEKKRAEAQVVGHEVEMEGALKQQEFGFKVAEHQMDMQSEQQKMQMEREKHAQKMQVEQEKAHQQMVHKEAQTGQQMQQNQDKAKLEISLKEAQGRQKARTDAASFIQRSLQMRKEAALKQQIMRSQSRKPGNGKP